MLKDCRYGLYMGALFAPVNVLSQAIFPSNRSDDEAGGLILAVYLATFVYYGTAGFLGVRKSIFMVPVFGVIGAASGGFGSLLAARISGPKTNSGSVPIEH